MEGKAPRAWAVIAEGVSFLHGGSLVAMSSFSACLETQDASSSGSFTEESVKKASAAVFEVYRDS